MEREETAERSGWLPRQVMRGLHPARPAFEDDPDITLGQLHCLCEVRRLGARVQP